MSAAEVARHITEKAESGIPPITRILGDWVAGLSYDAIPEVSIGHAKRCLLDGFGCGLYGNSQEWGAIASAVAVEFSSGGPSSLWGRGQRTGPADAAMVNGTGIHGFEIDDVHVASMLHPGAVVLPAVIATAEARGKSGKDVLAAIVAGYEVMIRMGMCAGLNHKLRGYHVTPTNGTIGAAAAVANLLGLDGEGATNALGIATTEACGLYAARKGAMTKRLHGGLAARNGVVAGYLAERGFTGAKDGLEAPDGGFFSTMSADCDLSIMTDDLGRTWHIDDIGFKAYASCASTHTTIDCLDELMGQGLSAENLDRLTVHMSKAGFTNVGWAYKPADVVGMQMNGGFVASVKLLEGEVFIDQFTPDRMGDPKILALIPKIDIMHDPEIDAYGLAKRHTVRIEAKLKDGRTLSATREQRTGSAQYPLSQRFLESKFRRTAGAVIPAPSAAWLIELVGKAETLTDIAEVSALLVTPKG